MNNNKLLGELYYYIGKQTTNFRITHSYIDNEGKKHFSKWIHYLDANEFQINNATHRTLLKNEIVLDFDRNKEETKKEVTKRFVKAINYLKEKKVNFKAFDTTSNGYHVHIFMNKLSLMTPKERKEYRLNVIKAFDCDLQKASDNVTIALEGSKHWKTGEEMIEVCKGV